MTSAPRLLLLFLLLLLPAAAAADGMPANVDKASHAWLKKTIPQTLPKLIQTRRGALPKGHLHVVEELGNWGAGRSKGKHQGTDFVLDLPHKGKKEQLFIGSLVRGTVAHVNKNWGSYGNVVFIYRSGSPKLVFIYAHLDSVSVAIGDKVTAGSIIGTFGCTGNCKGLRGKHIQNQVHVEVYVMPDDFDPDTLTWSHLPMGQLRRAAVNTGGRGKGVDLGRYFGKGKVKMIDRDALGDKYQKNADAGLDAFVRGLGKKKKKKKGK